MTKNIYNITIKSNDKKVNYKAIGSDINDALWNLKQSKRPNPDVYDCDENKDWYDKVDKAVSVNLLYEDVCI